MNTPSLQQIHRLVDILNPAEYDIVYMLLTKFIAEAEPYPDELEAARRLDKAIASNETLGLEAVDWS